MPPRPFTPLWCSGRKLNGPPEGYGWRKEAQVKRWISQLPEPNDCSQPDQTSCTDDPPIQDFVPANVETENVEDSKIDRVGGSSSKINNARTTSSESKEDNDDTQAASLPPMDEEQAPSHDLARQSCEVSTKGETASRDGDGPDISEADFETSKNVSNVQFCPGDTTSHQEKLNQDCLETFCSAQGDARARWPEVPLDVRLDSFSEFSPDVRLAAGLILARASAHVSPGEDAYKWSLLTSVAEKEEMKGEQEILTADLERRNARISKLDDELSSVRKSLLDVQRKFKGRLIDAEDRENSLKFHAINLERSVVDACEQLKLNDEKHIKVMQELQRELMESTSRNSSLEREFSQFRSDKLVEMTQIRTTLDSMREELKVKDALILKLKSERDEAIRGWETEATHRIEAEDSERLALNTAASQAELTAEMRSALAKSKSLGVRASWSQTRVLAAEPRNSSLRGARNLELARTPTERTLQLSSHSLEACSESDLPAKNRGSELNVMRRRMKKDRKFLKEVIQNQRKEEKTTLEMERKQVMSLKQSAPQALKVLGFAFRVYIMPNGRDQFAAQVSGILSGYYSVFVDPSVPYGRLEEDVSECEEAVPFSGLSHSVIFFATRGSLSSPRCTRELVSARQSGSVIIFVVESGIGIGDLGCTDNDRLSDIVQHSWNQRIEGDHDEISVAEKVRELVGLPDHVLNKFPTEALLNMKKSSAMVHQSKCTVSRMDLARLHGLVDLEIDWNSGGQTPSGKENEGLCLEEHLSQIIEHNKTMRTLKIGGCPPPVAQRFGRLLVSAKPCLKTFTINVQIPVSMLLGAKSSQAKIWRIDGCLLRSADVALISELIPHCHSLKELIVGEAPKLSSSDAEILGASVRSLVGLERFNDVDLRPLSSSETRTFFDCSGKHLGCLGMIVLSGVWKRPFETRKLEYVNLGGCGIGDYGARVLASCVQKIDATNLKAFMLEGNRLGPDGCSTLSIEILQRCIAISRLDLSNNEIGDDGAGCLAETIGSLDALHVLRLGRNKIGGEGAEKLAYALRKCKMLRELDFEGNFVGDIGSLALGKVLGEDGYNGGLRLSLRDNFNVGASGAKAIGKALGTSSTLKVVDLGNNHLGGDGCKQIALGLRANASLVELDVASCKLRAEGAEHLAEALKENSTLEVLDVSRNAIGDRGASALAAMLNTNTSIKVLDVCTNNIGMIGFKSLHSSLKEKCCNVREARMRGNKIEDALINALEKTVSNRCKGDDLIR